MTGEKAIVVSDAIPIKTLKVISKKYNTSLSTIILTLLGDAL